jgi:WD40 repeat protein
LRKNLRATGAGVSTLALCPDGSILVTGIDRGLHLTDINMEREIKMVNGRHGGIWSIDFCPDGRLLASGDNDNCIRLCDFAKLSASDENGTAPRHVSR